MPIIVQLSAETDDWDAFRAALASFVSGADLPPSFVSLRAMRNRDHPNRITVIEEWTEPNRVHSDADRTEAERDRLLEGLGLLPGSISRQYWLTEDHADHPTVCTSDRPRSNQP